ncbi:MAG: serine hydrolase domain-containing protein [Anaerolineae bacterium]
MRAAVFSTIAAGLPARLAEAGLPSLAIAVAHHSAIVWEHAVGWADRARRLPATPHTPYALASISKPITATALMLLVERGLVDLDRPINDYLGDTPLRACTGRAEDATVRRIASHSAGLPTHCHFFYADECSPWGPNPATGISPETIRRYGKLMLPPGEQYCYSNLGYGLIDRLITRVTGMPYADFMRREVFLPLGLTRAAVGLAPELAPFAAARYNPAGLPLPDYDFDHRGGSAIWCSAHDLIRFALLHLGTCLPDQRAILSAAAVGEMQQPLIPVNERRHYGIGWAVDPDGFGYRGIEHRGSMGGVNTILRLLPDEGLAVAVLCNAQTDLHVEVLHEVIGTVLPAYATNRAQFEAVKPPAPAPTPFAPPPELLGHWGGSVATYEGDRPLYLYFRPNGDVHVRLGNQLETIVSDARFTGNAFTGEFAGDLRVEDTVGHRRLRLDLRLRDGALAGPLTAFAFPADEGGRMRNALSFWTNLER